MQSKEHKYLVFAHFRFYPHGGMRDYYGSASSKKCFEDIKSAIEKDEEGYDFAHIVDLKTLKIICEGEKETDYIEMIDKWTWRHATEL